MTLNELPDITLKLPSLVDRTPSGGDWIHELKLDGYRMQIRLAEGKVRLLTRSGHDWTERLPETADAVASVSADSAVFDGELVALDRSGAADFSSLQSAFSHGRTGKLVLFLFDLMFLNGKSLTERPLVERKALLEPLVRAAGPRLQYLDHVAGSPQPLLEACRRRGLEGIVSKRGDRPYRGGRARDWVKTKFRRRERFVIGGVQWSSDAVAGIGALAVGYFRPSGDLVGCGKVGGGWSQAAGTRLAEQLRALQRRTCPFSENVSAFTKPRSKPTWVEPTLVVEVAFAGVTAEGNLRHASLIGVEANLPAASTIRDSISDDLAPGDFDASPVACDRPQDKSAPNRKTGRVASNRRGASMLQSIGDVKVTNPERILFPDSGITKLDLIEYFVQVSQWLLPHVQNRVVSLVRCPSGIEEEKFFQRHPLRGMPDAIRSVTPADEKQALLTIDSTEGLIAAAQMNVIELHPWGSRIDRPDRPDRIVFDLDPDAAVPWQDVTAAAWMIGRQLERRGLTTFVKTTGGKGLHLVVPVVRRYGWEKVSQWCSEFVDELVAAEPKRFTGNQSKRVRRGRIFIDHHRNRRGSTSVAAYCVRARGGAPVSVPIRWEELSSLKDPAPWTLGNVPQRLKSLREDPWAGIENVRQYLK